jgi:UDP-glucuronate 4-epimerase
MRIVVTGAAGFIGSHLCARLLADGHTVIGIDNYNADIYDSSHKLINVAQNKDHINYTDVHADVLSYNFVDALADVIVHLAGYANVRMSFIEPALFVRNNVECTTKILDDITKCQSKPRLIYASSSSVYGENTKVPFVETDELTNIVSPYALTKKMCEDLVDLYASTKQVDAIGLRFFTVYGPGGRPDMAVYKFLRSIVKGRQIIVYGDGSMQRDYTYVEDIVNGICLSIYKPTCNGHTVYNLGNNQPVSLHKLIELCEETTGKKANVVYEPAPIGDVPITYADITKATTELGYCPRIGLREGLKRMLAF